MMKGTYTLQCPYAFYNGHNLPRASCETANIYFKDWQQYEEYLSKYCCNLQQWHKCSIAFSNETYYDRTNGKNIAEFKKPGSNQHG